MELREGSDELTGIDPRTKTIKTRWQDANPRTDMYENPLLRVDKDDEYEYGEDDNGVMVVARTPHRRPGRETVAEGSYGKGTGSGGDKQEAKGTGAGAAGTAAWGLRGTGRGAEGARLHWGRSGPGDYPRYGSGLQQSQSEDRRERAQGDKGEAQGGRGRKASVEEAGRGGRGEA